MKIKKEKTYTTLTYTNDCYSDFYTIFVKEIINLHDEHIILDIRKCTDLDSNSLDQIVDFYKNKNIENKSFIIVVNKVLNQDIDIDIVTTMTEANDILEFDNIERELNF